MIFVELTSGLGNQLFQYATARSLALTHQQQLVLDNRFFLGNHYRSPRLHYFETGSFFTLPLHPLSYRIADFISSGSQAVIQENEWWQFTPFPVKVNTMFTVLKGGFCSMRYFSNHASIIREELRVKKKYKQRIQHKLTEIDGSNSVAIHVRKGDYVQSAEAKAIFTDLDIAYYQRAVEYVRARIDNPVFYVFTNDSDWVRQHLLPGIKIPLIIVSNETDWEDYEEFEMMKKCKNQIIANSTFSWWAAFLNLNPDKIIIQPKQWYVHQQAQESYSTNQLIGHIGNLL